jgi:hypothetical protein
MYRSTVPGVIYCRDATQNYEEAYFGEREEAREGREKKRLGNGCFCIEP